MTALRLHPARPSGVAGRAQARAIIARPTAGFTPIGVLSVPLGRSPVASAARSPHHQVTRSANSIGSCVTPGSFPIAAAGARIGGLPGYVAAPVRDGVDQPFIAQHLDSAPRGGARNLELFNQLALRGYAGIRRVLARRDPAPEYLGYLPVRRNRRNRVNPVSAPISHIDNFSCTGVTSYASTCLDASSYVCRQGDTGSRTLWITRQGRWVAPSAIRSRDPAGQPRTRDQARCTGEGQGFLP
jgi:hypothetical protein